MFCTHCGASNKDDANHCTNCNESLRDNPVEEKLSRLKGSTGPSPFHEVNFLRPLFDFSFSQFVTIKMIKFLYLLSMLSAGLISLSFIVAEFNTSFGFGIFALFIGAPLVFLFTVMSSRVFLEMALRVFRMADHLADKGTANAKEKPELGEGIQWKV
jgi:hypothetical protein